MRGTPTGHLGWLVMQAACLVAASCQGQSNQDGTDDEDVAAPIDTPADHVPDTGTEIQDATFDVPQDTPADDTGGDPGTDSADAWDSETPADDGGGDPDSESADARDEDMEEDEACEPGDLGFAPSETMEACLRIANCSEQYARYSFLPHLMCMPSFPIESHPLAYDFDTMIYVERQIPLWKEVRSHETCIAASADCAGAFACLNGGATEPCSITIPATPFEGIGCSGTVLETCAATMDLSFPELVFRHDCADDGLTCIDLGSQGAVCGSTDCTTPGGPSCNGTVLEYCAGPGARYARDCVSPPGFGPIACGDADPATAGLQAGCVPVGDACSEPSVPSAYCEGSVMHHCDPLSRIWTWVDCTIYGPLYDCRERTMAGEAYFGCYPDTAGSGCTLPSWPTCDCGDLLFCDTTSETDVRIHCQDYGFGTCEPVLPGEPEMGAVCNE